MSTEVYAMFAIAIGGAAIPVAQAIPRLDGRLEKGLLVAGVVLGVLAALASAYGTLRSAQHSPVPPAVSYLIAVGFFVVLLTGAAILLTRALPMQWAVVTVAIVGVVALVVAVTFARSAGGEASELQIDVEENPRAIAVSPQGVWIAHADGEIRSIDPSSSSVVGSEIKIPLSGAELFHIAVGLGYIWAMDTDGWIHKVNPDSRKVSQKIFRVGDEAGEMTVSRGYVWVNGYSSGLVARMAPNAEKKVFSVRASSAADLAIGGGSVWVANDDDSQLTRLEPQSGDFIEHIPLSGKPNDIAFDRETVFTTYYYDRKLVAIDPESGEERWRAPLERQPSGIASSNGSVWVSNYASDTVTKISIKTGIVEGTFPSAGGPSDVAAGFGSIWIPNFDSDTVTRIADSA